MVGRIRRSADFERALALPPCSRSAHFAVHHVAAGLSLPAKGGKKRETEDLSTADAPSCAPAVDESAIDGWWLGTVVPKRQARRAVTRNFIKRQMRAVMVDQAGALPQGLWVLRLKTAFDVARFASPGSAVLRVAVRDELKLLLQRTASSASAKQTAPSKRPAP